MPMVDDPVPSVTIAIECPSGTVFVTICEDELVRVDAGKTGKEGATSACAMGMLITYIRLLGGKLSDVADLIRGISYEESNRLAFDALSIPDAVAQAIDQYLEDSDARSER